MVADEEAKHCQESSTSRKYANSNLPRGSMREALRKLGTNLLQAKVHFLGVRLAEKPVDGETVIFAPDIAAFSVDMRQYVC